MTFAPIALFAYARPRHLERTIDSLLRNAEARQSDLIAFADGARTPEKRAAVDHVRRLLHSIKGFRSVTVQERPENFGLSRSITSGVTQVLRDYERVIVLEDDMETSPHFLAYMNAGLTKYALDERVISIHGYVYPTDATLPETFFMRGADCWGWATWRRAWRLYEPEAEVLLRRLRESSLEREFDLNGSYPFSAMLEAQTRGKIDSWAIRWHAAAFLADKLTLYPARSLLQNIGNDSSGTHSGISDRFDTPVATIPITLSDIPLEQSVEGASAIEDYFRRHRLPLVARIRQRAGILLRRFL